MPIHDAPAWRMNDRAAAHVERHAPQVREWIAGIMAGLEDSGVDWNDAQSFGAEVAASLANLLADRAMERRNDTHPHRALSHHDALLIMVSDIQNRAVLRKLRKDD